MAIAVFTGEIQITDSDGVIVSGAEVNVYAAGTTTPLSVYSDPDLLIGHIAANPIICDSAGRHDMRYIAAAAYKLVVRRTGAGTIIFTRDYIDPGVPIGTGALAIANGGTSATTAAAAIAALGGATSTEVADIAAQVAAVTGSLGSTAKTHIATGTTAQRDGVPTAGDFRRNTTTARWEGYVAAWENFFTDTEIASQAQAEAGSVNTVVMTPARVAQAIIALTPRVLLATLTASNSASLADTTSLTSTYSRYAIVFSNIIPATDATTARLKINSGGVQSTTYLTEVLSLDGAVAQDSSVTTYIPMSVASKLDSGGAGGGLCGEVTIFAPSSTTIHKMVVGTLGHANNTGAAANLVTVSGYWNGGVTAVTGIEVTMAAGNITSGTVKIYGLR